MKLLKLLKNKFILATIPVIILSCTIPEKKTNA